MALNSLYCKAYRVGAFRQYPKWTESVQNLRKIRKVVDGKEIEEERKTLQDSDILYLHDNHTVVDGIFYDEHIVFDAVTDEWRSFCATTLEFKVPEPAVAAQT